MLEITPVAHLPVDALAPLVAESEAEGFRFLRRLIDEWASGANRFDRPGERLFLARDGARIVGVCGLNINPYAGDSSVGRVRRLFVAAAYRRAGIASALLRAVIAEAGGRFTSLRLRTDNPAAGGLYERLGFRPVGDAAGFADTTHWLRLGPS